MALNYYQGTNENSTSGWKRTFHSEFKSSTGKVYRVEIIDSKTGTRSERGFGGTGSQPFLLGPDGATVSWNGSADNLHDTFLTSELTLDMVVEGVYHRQLWTQLQSMEDSRFGVCLWAHNPVAGSSTSSTTPDPDPDGFWSLEWAGLLQAEGVEFVDHEVNQLIRLKFSDGLPRLNEEPFLDENLDPFTGAMTLAEVVEICLSRIPTSTLFGYGFGTTSGTLTTGTTVPLWKEEPFVLSSDMDNVVAGIYSTLHNTRVSASAFYTIEKKEDSLGGDFVTKEAATCAEVLRNVLSLFRYRISFADGCFYISNPAALLETSYLQTFAYVGHEATKSPSTVGTTLTTSSKRLAFDASGSSRYVPGKGFTSGLLFPIKQAISVHAKGGAVKLLTGNPGDLSSVGVHNQTSPGSSVYRVRHATASPVTLSNSEAILEGEEPFLLAATCVHSDTGWNYGSTSVADAFRGSKMVLSMKIKVGNYYLKRDLVSASASNSVNINITAATDIDFLDWSQSGAVEWTTNSADTYDLVVPFVGCEPEPPVVLQGTDNDIQRVGGFHLALHSSEDQFQFGNGFLSNGTLQSDCEFSFEWVPPPLPTGTHTGLEFTASVRYYDNDNTEITGTTLTDNVTTTMCQAWTNFAIYSSPIEDDEDINFSASVGPNTAVVKVAESILGDKYVTPSVATLKHRDPASPTSWSYTTQSWRTLSELDTYFIHRLNALEGLRERSTPTRLFTGSILFNSHDFAAPAWNLVSYTPPIRPFNLVRYSVTEGATAVDYDALPLDLTWTVRSNTFDGTFAVLNVDRTITPTEDDDTDKAVKGVGGSATDTPNETSPTAALYAVKGEALSGGTGTGLTTEQETKLSYITLGTGGIADFTTDGTVLTSDEVDDSTSSHKFATAAQLTSISNNAADITSLETAVSNIQTVLKDTTGGGGVGVYTDSSKTTSASYVGLSSTEAKLQAGTNTGYNATETSPGTLTMSVQVGQTGAETSLDALTITGNTNGKAAVQAGTGVATVLNGLTASGLTLDGTTIVPGSGSIITATERTKLNGIEAGAEVNPTSTDEVTEGTTNLYHTSARVDARIAAASVTDLSDMTSAGSGAVITAAERTKLSGIATGAEVNVQSDWNATSGDALILNKPTVPEEFADLAGNSDDIPEGQTNKFFTDSERTKLSGIQPGAEVNVVETNLATANQTVPASTERQIQLGSTGTLSVTSGSTNLIRVMQIVGSSTTADINFTGAVKMDSGTMAGGSIRLEEFGGGGQSAVTLKAPTYLSADVDFTLPDADGTNGQVLTTNGSGALSFTTVSGGGGGGMTETPLVTVSGRWQWSSADSLERVFTGSTAYGPTNWYSHSQEPSNSTLRTYSSSHTVDTTTTTISAFQTFAYGIPLPSDSKKVRVKAFARYQNGNTFDFGWSLWHCPTGTSGSTASPTVTLVAKSSDLSPTSSSTTPWHDTFTTTSALSGGFVFLLAEHRSGSLTTTTYAYGLASLFLVD